MNTIYTKIMEFLIGKALANSDRIKVVVAGFVATALIQLGHSCGFCGGILTPEVTDWLSKAVAGAVVTLVLAITHRDVAAPGQTVGTDGSFPPPPVSPDGVPGA